MIIREAHASVGQRLLWFMDHYRGGAGVLNCPLVLRLRGSLDLPALQFALDSIVSRHEALRTTFRGKGRTLTQVIHAPDPVKIAMRDLQGSESTFDRELTAELRTSIDPAEWPVRVTLWRLGERDHVLCFNMHHLVTDGHSCGVLLRELQSLYEAVLGNSSAELPEIPWQYAEFSQWEADLFKGTDFQRHADYWHRQLENTRLPALPFASRDASPERHTQTRSAVLSGDDVVLLRNLARARGTTAFNVMLSLCYAVLAHITGESDLALGSVFLNRPMPQVQLTVGFFANLLVLRTQAPAEASFSDLLRNSHITVMDAFMHQSLSYYMLPAHLLEKSPLRADELVFQMMTRPLGTSRMGRVRIDPLVVEGVGNRFDFELAIVNTEGNLSAVVSFNSDRISTEWSQAFLSRYVQTASLVARDPELRLSGLELDFPTGGDHGG